jgi:VanZ family protein
VLPALFFTGRMRYCPVMTVSNPSPALNRSPYPLRLAALLAWAASIALLSLAANVNVPSGVLGWDKFNHFAAYALLALLLIRTLQVRRHPSARLLIVSWLICIGYGLLLEGLQWFMEAGRRGEAGDLLANALGALATCVVFRQFTGRSFQHER